MPVFLAFFLGALAAATLPALAASLVVSAYLTLALLRYEPLPMFSRALRQWWRLKWLLLATLVLMAGPVPGEPLAEGLPEFLPSAEGLRLGIEQALRVMAVVLLYAALPGAMSAPERILALRSLLGRLGSGGRRFGLRLALTLDALERAQRGDHWQTLKDARLEDAAVLPALPAARQATAREIWECSLFLLIFLAAAWIGKTA